MPWRQEKQKCLFDYWDWRNNWRSIIDFVERLCLSFFSRTWEQDKILIVYIFLGNDITGALKSPIEYNLGEDIFVLQFVSPFEDNQKYSRSMLPLIEVTLRLEMSSWCFLWWGITKKSITYLKDEGEKMISISNIFLDALLLIRNQYLAWQRW